MEAAVISVQRDTAGEILEPLREAHQFFKAEGHQALIGKSELLLAIAEGQSGNGLAMVQHLLNLQPAIKSDPHANALLAFAGRLQEKITPLKKVVLSDIPLQEIQSAIRAYQKRVPSLRRALRQRVVAVPFAPPMIHIRSFGKLQVHLGQRAVTNADWQTQFTRDLLFTLLAHPEGLTREEIGSIFWPEQSPKEVKFRFKNTIYRLRRALGKEVIYLEQEHYRFNNDLDYEYDVETFMDQHKQALQETERSRKMAHFREMIKVYKGSYASEIPYTWTIPLREGFHQYYINVLMQMAQMHLEMSEHEAALDFCQRAIEADNLLEEAYRLSLRIYAAMGNRAGLERQYQRCREALLRDLNAEPSQQTQSLSHELTRQS